jgi:hypothetical protein
MMFEIAVFLATIICLVIGAFWVRTLKQFSTGLSFNDIVETIIVMLSSFVVVISILKLLFE